MPSGIVEAFCTKLRSEGISSDTAVAVVRRTEPIISQAAIRALANAYGKDASAIPLAAGAPDAMPVSFGGGSCNVRPVEAIDEERHSDVMVVQLSNAVANPFGRAEAGVFVRFTVGGRDAQWYWIPLAERNGQWLVGYVIPLAVRE